MTCKACGQLFGCNHSDAEYQGVVPPLTLEKARQIVSAHLKPESHTRCNCRDRIARGDWDDGLAVRSTLAALEGRAGHS